MASIELKGGDRLLKRLAEIGKQFGTSKTVKAGFLDGETYPDGTSVATVAAINNYGAPAAGIPPRPFMTNMVQKNAPAWGSELLSLYKRTGGDIDKTLTLMGDNMVAQIKQSIHDMNEPANAMATNLLKDRFPKGGYEFADVLKAWADVAAGKTAPAGKPLVWSGQLFQDVHFEVVE